jgi:hypothetical protein
MFEFQLSNFKFRLCYHHFFIRACLDYIFVAQYLLDLKSTYHIFQESIGNWFLEDLQKVLFNHPNMTCSNGPLSQGRGQF